MTIGELKKFISDLPDDMEINVCDSEGELLDIGPLSRLTKTNIESNISSEVVVIYPIVVYEEGQP